MKGSAISQLVRQGAGVSSDTRLLSAVGYQSAGRLLLMTMHWCLPSCMACSWLLTVGLRVQTLALQIALGRPVRKLPGRALGAASLQGQEVGVKMLMLAASKSCTTCQGRGAPGDALCTP